MDTLPESLHSLQVPPAYTSSSRLPLSLFGSGVLCGAASKPVPILGLSSMPGGVLAVSLTLDCDPAVC